MRTTLALVLALLVAPPAAAQYDLPEAGDLGIFFDPAALSIEVEVPPFVPFEFHLVAFGPGGVTGWEAGFTQPYGMFVLDLEYSEPAALEIGLEGNHIVGLGGCQEYSGPVTLLRVEALLSYAGEQLLCLLPTEPSSFSPPTPGWVDCAEPPASHAFGVAMNGGGIYPNGCAVINPEGPYIGVAVEAGSFGSWKSGGP